MNPIFSNLFICCILINEIHYKELFLVGLIINMKTFSPILSQPQRNFNIIINLYFRQQLISIKVVLEVFFTRIPQKYAKLNQFCMKCN